MRGNQVRLFDKQMAELPDVQSLPPKKMTLRKIDAVVIPPHVVGFIQVSNDQDFEGDVFVDSVTNQRPGYEYIITGCVTKANGGVLAVRNSSPHELNWPHRRLVARGICCTKESTTDEVRAYVLSACDVKLFQLENVKPQMGDALSDDEKLKLLNLLNEFRDCFAQDTSELGKTNITEMGIDLSDDKPVTYRPYRLSYAEREQVRNMIQDLLDNGIIQESTSPFSSPILLIKKKKTGDYRLCVDLRALNAKTVKIQFPMPRVDEHLDRVSGHKYFIILDLASGYYQIKMAKESIRKTAFITPDGHYEFLRMDDILILTIIIEEGFELLREVLLLFREAGMTFRLSKCFFFPTKIDYFGHELSSEGLKPGELKTKAVTLFPQPKNVHEIRQFLGLTGYFRKFVKRYAQVARPLTDLIKKETKFGKKRNIMHSKN